MKIPFFEFRLENIEQERAIIRVLNSSKFILGPETSKFEEYFAKYSQSDYCVGVSNGLDALKLSLISLGIGNGDKVIIPAHTFFATALAVSLVGADPIFCDVDLETNNIDLEALNKVTKNVKAIIPVHLYGLPCNMDKITSFAKSEGVHIVEDFAQAHGACWRGQKVGSFGIVNATSFYPTKNLGAIGDGGACTTSDEELYKVILKLRNYGSERKYEHDIIGYNNRLDEIQAAVLSYKLGHLDTQNDERRKLAKYYLNRLSHIEELQMPVEPENCYHVWHLFTVTTNLRNELMKYLKDYGIETLIHYPIPVHLQKAYSNLGISKGTFPIAEKIAETSLTLPLYLGMISSEVDFVCDKICGYFG